jgi:hypothetical protein
MLLKVTVVGFGIGIEKRYLNAGASAALNRDSGVLVVRRINGFHLSGFSGCAQFRQTFLAASSRSIWDISAYSVVLVS